jgi:hypothetical protein
MEEQTLPKLMQDRAELWGSFLFFCETFFPLVTGRPFIISAPTARESHHVTIARELTKCARLETRSLLINVPPGYGKSVMLSMFVAWVMSRWPDSNHLYIAYGHELAAKHTAFIKKIMENSVYQYTFDIKIRHDSKAKDFFQTTAGGIIRAFGSSGSITGQDAGLPGLNRYSGSVIIDDPLKPDEAHSDTVRANVIRNYRETILQRPRSENVPIICIAQRLHEDDLPAFMLSGNDERHYKSVILKAIDDAGNALYPEVNSLAQLKEKQLKNEYVFAGQYQQNPLPSGGALFRREYFVMLDEEPDIICTFITADTAETSKNYNDASVFSFWGLYKLPDSEDLALHWINCWEIRVEPKDLESEFRSFYADCMLHAVKPRIAAIEKKSTGVTLLSVLQDMRGLHLREVKRTRASGNKTDRFLEMQPIIASKLISFTFGARHADMCITHMTKITANESHRFDDIADSVFDACKIALIDKTLYVDTINKEQDNALAGIAEAQQQRRRAMQGSNNYGSYR